MKYFHISGFIVHPNNLTAPIALGVYRNSLDSERDLLEVRHAVIEKLKLKDFLIFNIITLEKTLTEDEITTFRASEIAEARYIF